jgi:hypothetical protein
MSRSPSTPRLRITIALLVAVLVLVAVSERGWATGLAGEALQLAGLAGIACAALGRVWTSVFIAGRKDEALVRAGPYSALRHPLYGLSLLAALGIDHGGSESQPRTIPSRSTDPVGRLARDIQCPGPPPGRKGGGAARDMEMAAARIGHRR